ncbi:MAG: hypothetical protein U0791_19390 [Gemmataceae bacterium]
MLKRFFRPETAFFLAVWLILLIAFRERGFYDPGALWHIRVGDLIQERGFPQHDPFTYTFEGHIWIPQQWGAEVLMSAAHRIGGFDTMLLGFAALVAGLFTMIYRRASQSGMGPLLAAILVGGSLSVGAFHYFVRPHMFTIALMGWTMMCVVDYERGRVGVWRIVGLIPLFVIWTNLHGGVLGGTLTLGAAVAGWGLIFLANRYWKPIDVPTPIANWRSAWLLVGIVAACGLTPFVNPFGLELLNTWQRIVGSRVLQYIVNEHMPLDPSTPLGMTVVGFGIFYLVMLGGVFPKLPRVSWLVPLIWLALSFKGIRQAPLFAITAAVSLVDLWPHTVWHRLLVKYGDGSLARAPSGTPNRSASWAAIPAIAVFASFLLHVNHVPVPVVGAGWARLDDDFIPVELTAEMQAYAASRPPGTRIFNDANLGGYLIYHTPSLKIFMDDRCELYGDEAIAYYSETMGLPPEQLGPRFEEWSNRLKFERAIVMIDPTGESKPPIEQYLSGRPGEWREVARAKRAAIYERVK